MNHMKLISYIGILVFITAFSSVNALSQDCKKFHLYGNCMQYLGSFYKVDGQSRSNVIGVGDKLLYNVIFYGERDYKLYFCATDLFLPVYYVLLDDLTKEVIYDSKNDKYPESLELSIETTRRIVIEISVLALKTDKQITENYFGCVGFLLNWKPKKK
jgi:hypothetical protein